jgi:hypothetical protein
MKQSGVVLISSKLVAAHSEIRKFLADPRCTKVILFSEFVEQCQALAWMCERESIPHVLYFGAMHQAQKEAALIEFKEVQWVSERHYKPCRLSPMPDRLGGRSRH